MRVIDTVRVKRWLYHGILFNDAQHWEWGDGRRTNRADVMQSLPIWWFEVRLKQAADEQLRLRQSLVNPIASG